MYQTFHKYFQLIDTILKIYYLYGGIWTGGCMRDKRRKFVELAEARVTKSLKDLQLIGNLSNKSAYEYSDDDVRKVFLALQKGLDEAKGRFKTKSNRDGGEFKL